MSRKAAQPSMHIRRTAGDRVFDTFVIILFLAFTFICMGYASWLALGTVALWR